MVTRSASSIYSLRILDKFNQNIGFEWLWKNLDDFVEFFHGISEYFRCKCRQKNNSLFRIGKQYLFRNFQAIKDWQLVVKDYYFK